MPLGWRVHRKIEQIIREEMDAIGGQEMLMPVITPAELWEATGRIGIPEIFHLQDRTGRRFILPVTHEETATFHAREIQSYKQLPQLWYHFQTKGPRRAASPRRPPARARVRHEGRRTRSTATRRASCGASRRTARPTRRSSSAAACRRTTSRPRAGSWADSSASTSSRPSGSGENTLVLCENGDYAADLEVARAIPSDAQLPEPLDAPEEIETPGVTTIEGLAEFLGIDESATSKAMPVVKDDGTLVLVLALVRGDDRLSETKLYDALPGRVPARDRRRDPRRLRRRRRIARAGRLRR